MYVRTVPVLSINTIPPEAGSSLLRPAIGQCGLAGLRFRRLGQRTALSIGHHHVVLIQADHRSPAEGKSRRSRRAAGERTELPRARPPVSRAGLLGAGPRLPLGPPVLGVRPTGQRVAQHCGWKWRKLRE